MHEAVTSNYTEVVKVLLRYGASVDVLNLRGQSALDLATTEAMKQLLREKDLYAPTGCRPQPRSCKMLVQANSVDGRFSSTNDRRVVVTSGLTGEERMVLESQVLMLGGEMAGGISDHVTHLVVKLNEQGQCPRTLKYLQSLLRGAWIVRHHWVDRCAKALSWVEEGPYEVQTDTHGVHGIPARARVNQVNQLPKLFDGCCFFLAGEFSNPSKPVLAGLIQAAGGKVGIMKHGKRG